MREHDTSSASPAASQENETRQKNQQQTMNSADSGKAQKLAQIREALAMVEMPEHPDISSKNQSTDSRSEDISHSGEAEHTGRKPQNSSTSASEKTASAPKPQYVGKHFAETMEMARRSPDAPQPEPIPPQPVNSRKQPSSQEVGSRPSEKHRQNSAQESDRKPHSSKKGQKHSSKKNASKKSSGNKHGSFGSMLHEFWNYEVHSDSQVPLAARLALYAGGCLSAVLLVVHCLMMAIFSNRFLPNTYVNNVNIGGMTMAKASEALLDARGVSDLKLTTARGDVVSISADAYSAYYTIRENTLSKPYFEKRSAWFKKLFTPTEYFIDYNFNYSLDQLTEIVNNYKWGDQETVNATIEKDDSGTFRIVPEEQGDQFDAPVLMQYIEAQLKSQNFSINMEDSGCYKNYLPTIYAPDLEDKVELCNQFKNCSITFDFSDRKRVVDGLLISEWVNVDSFGELTFDYDAIYSFVCEMADETDTYGTSRGFHSTLDGYLTLEWGDFNNYGWQIDRDATTGQIIDLIQEGETLTVEPIYTDWGHGFCRETDDIGNTYVEVDISAQHVWYYRNGALIMESDCVTGMESKADRRTHRGIFQILNLERNVVLKGADYAAPVNYWMPFNYNGEGLHDYGRSAWGGQIYINNGSHGCVNLPRTFAADLFDALEVGTPVLIHE